jgi:hypothetical protein
MHISIYTKNKQTKAFDVVLVVEQFSLQGPSLLLQEVLGVPDLWLGHARTNSRPHNTPPPEIVERMKLDNAIDIELHQFATEYSLRLFKEFNLESPMHVMPAENR